MAETVRIKPGTHAKLKELAERIGEPMPLILEKAVEAYRRQCFLEHANHAFRMLRQNPKAWQHELAERAEWEATLADGQEDD
mgnify:CR=1 FL=1